MNPNKALWEKGDFTRLAETMRGSGAAFVAGLGIGPGIRVLDLGCGDGTTALPAARLGADVLGVDIASNLVAAGRRRATEAGLGNLRFEEGDASHLDALADTSFDLVVSVFGAMFAPRPDDVAREMVRVTKPGGRIVMGNWIPGDPTLVAQILQISAAYALSPPAGFVSPMLWGQREEVARRFGVAGISADAIAFANERFRFVFPGTPAMFFDEFRTFYGPMMTALEAAERDGRADRMIDELIALFEEQNESVEPDRTEMSVTFLRVTVTVG